VSLLGLDHGQRNSAVDAAHNGDPTPYLELWSTTDPVTVFGSLASATGGSDEVRRTLRALVTRFSRGTPLDFQLVAAEVGGELAYSAAIRQAYSALTARSSATTAAAPRQWLPDRDRGEGSQPPGQQAAKPACPWAVQHRYTGSHPMVKPNRVRLRCRDWVELRSSRV
jgi:hypothetical protein